MPFYSASSIEEAATNAFLAANKAADCCDCCIAPDATVTASVKALDQAHMDKIVQAREYAKRAAMHAGNTARMAHDQMLNSKSLPIVSDDRTISKDVLIFLLSQTGRLIGLQFNRKQ